MSKGVKSKRPVAQSSSRVGNMILVVCGVGVILSVILGVLWSSSPSEQRVQQHFVERRRYDGRKSYKELAEERVPMVLTNTVVDRWPARKLFTTSFLAKKIKNVMAHIQEDKRTFITFHDNKPLEDHVTENWEDFNSKVNTTLPDILQWGSDNVDSSKGPFLYYTQDVATLSDRFPDVIGYLQPISDLVLSKENVQVNLWIGRQGIVTHTHYDCTYNFFFQLQGRKRFTLFPPNQTLYLYPCLHPHYGHSQVDILNPDYKKYPLFHSAQRTIAEVGPGDMLVVPPFWFHHVETLEESVSVNVWSDAPEYALINEVYSLPIPFDEEWDRNDMVKATKIYIDMVLSLLPIGNTSSFVGDLLTQRYDLLMRAGRLKLNTSTPECLKQCKENDWSVSLRYFEPILQRGVNATVSVLSKIPVRSTLEVCLGNYIEHLVSSILGLDILYPFLQHCAQININLF